jgi:hypothetical protein
MGPITNRLHGSSMKTKIWLLVGKVKGVCMSEWMGALAVDGATRSNYLEPIRKPLI